VQTITQFTSEYFNIFVIFVISLNFQLIKIKFVRHFFNHFPISTQFSAQFLFFPPFGRPVIINFDGDLRLLLLLLFRCPPFVHGGWLAHLLTE
jgi:hypothetical protein